MNINLTTFILISFECVLICALCALLFLIHQKIEVLKKQINNLNVRISRMVNDNNIEKIELKTPILPYKGKLKR